MNKPPYLVFDIGGTKTRFSVSLDGQALEPPVIVPTEKNYDRAMLEIKKLISAWDEVKFTMAVGGVAGSIDQDKGKIHFSPNLPNWSGRFIKGDLEKIFGVPVVIQNDTALVGLGEAINGAGKDYSIVAYITLSTGVNGVKIVNGKIDSNNFGFEIGHQIINFDANLHFNEYGRGTLEDYIGGAAIQAREGIAPNEIQKNSFWENVNQVFAIGLNNIILHWSPEIVILGGSVANKISIDLLKSNLAQTLSVFPRLPVIKKATLRDLGGLQGALLFASRQ